MYRDRRDARTAEYNVNAMQPLRADERDDLDEDEHAALLLELDASLAEADAGDTVDFAQALAELRQRR